MVEEMLLERGIVVSYETIRCCGKKVGSAYVGRLRRKAPHDQGQASTANGQIERRNRTIKDATVKRFY